MKKYICLLLLTSFCCAGLLAQSGNIVRDAPKNLNESLSDLSEQISKDLTENQKKRIAVVEFVDLKGSVTDLGRYLSEKLITKLFQTKKFTVVERQLLNKVVAEQKLSLTGIIDASTAQKLGKLLGVDAIAAGSISDLTKSMEINARLISTETGEVFSAASVQIIKDETVCNLMGGCREFPGTPGKTSPTPTPKPTPIKPKSWIVKSNFFTFELHGCQFSGTSVICNFTITNNDKDRKLSIVGTLYTGRVIGKMYDDLGNTSNCGSVEIANNKKEESSSTYLVNGVATGARIYCENVSANATKITRVDINFCPEGSDCFSIQYRNIPLLDSVQSRFFEDSIRQEQNNSNMECKARESRGINLKNEVCLQSEWFQYEEFLLDLSNRIKIRERMQSCKNLRRFQNEFG